MYAQKEHAHTHIVVRLSCDISKRHGEHRGKATAFKQKHIYIFMRYDKLFMPTFTGHTFKSKHIFYTQLEITRTLNY